MPIREFTCAACGQSVEEIRRMDDSSLPPCPACGVPMERVLSTPAPHRTGGHGHGGAGTCCGRETRCDKPPCGDGEACCR